MAKKIEGILTNMDNGPGCELGDGAGSDNTNGNG
jgi:hypothetical protein